MRNAAWLALAVLVAGCGGGESFDVGDDSEGGVDAADDSLSGDTDLGDTAADSTTDSGAVDSTTTDTGATDTAIDDGDTSTPDSFADTADASDAADTDMDSGTADTDVDSGATDASDATPDTGCTPGSTQSCYGGAATDLTAPSTACRAGIQYCIGGTFGPCIGEVRPSPESCNGLDDDCNGTVDDGLGTVTCGIGACSNSAPACVAGKPNTCTPKSPSAEICGNAVDEDCNGVVDACDCVYVAPTATATDTATCGTKALPCKTIQYAIDKAGTGSFAPQVCVASSFGCSGGGGVTTNYDENVTMKNGVSVLGAYDPSGWGRSNNCRTRVRAQSHNGLSFDATITSPTTLDRMEVQAHDGDATSVAITITGSTGAIVDDCVVLGATSGVTSSVGILVQDSSGTKATPLVRNSSVTGGDGSASAIGVRVVKSAPTLLRNCDDFDGSGRCQTWGCFGANRFIRGRVAGSSGAAASTTYGVRLEDAAGTVIDTSAVCSSDGKGDVAGVRLSGDSSGILIRKNQIVAPSSTTTGNVNAVGVWADACNGAAPWIVDNFRISGQSRTLGGRADGIRAVGDCHPRVDSNRLIVGGEESANNDANGVYCAKDAATGAASKCTILFNDQILGSQAGFPPNATGVRCDTGACARIERNRVISGNQGVNTFGLVLDGASTFVDGNGIAAGCTRGEGIGLLAIDAAARVQNNVIFGGSACTTGSGGSPTSAYGVRVHIGSGLDELDLHSNTISAIGASGGSVACTSRGLAFDLVAGATGGSRGIVRNNIVHGGQCATNFVVFEASAAADPRIFLDNDLWYSGTPTALYRDEAAVNLTTIASVNALADMTVSSNISADPLFTSATNLHIQSGSPCRNAGTSSGAPTTDMDRDPRPLEGVCDIGADEYKP